MEFSSSDIINIINIIVTTATTIIIVVIVTKKITDDRVLKNHLISEINGIRLEYRDFLKNISTGKITPKTVSPWFKLMNIKTQDLMMLIEEKYKIDKSVLSPFQLELLMLITEMDEFNSAYSSNDAISLNPSSLNRIIKFQQNYSNRFNKLIVSINDN